VTTSSLTTTGHPDPRIVSFDLMPQDPDFYFVLTEALGDFAARQRAEAEDGDNAESRLKWAETAEAALERIEAAMAERGQDGDEDLPAVLRRLADEDEDRDEPEELYRCSVCGDRIGIFQGRGGGWKHWRGAGTSDDPVAIFDAGHKATYGGAR
jgi:hypothetical protein